MTRISVVVPVRDAERYIAEALDSVLGQLGPDDEVVVVDDGSTDGTAGVLAGYGHRITVIPQDAVGTSRARNVAVAATKGEYVAFVDADDRWADGAVAPRLEALRADPSLAGVFGHSTEFLDDGITDPAAVGLRPPVEEPEPAWFLGSLLIRGDALRSTPFDETVGPAYTFIWIDRMRAQGFAFAHVDQVTYQRRIREGSSSTSGGYQTDVLRALRQNIQRRRL